MKQFTKEQAIALYNSKVWKNWTDEEIVRFQLFQEVLAVDFDRFKQALNSVLDRKVYGHELSSDNLENLHREYLGVKEPPTFEEILSLIPEKIITINL